MVVLGLGSNVGNRMKHLKEAIVLLNDILTDIQPSPVYETQALLTEEAPLAWNKPFLNMAVKGTTQLQPIELLKALKQIEKKLGRESKGKWSPRPIDIDILAWENKVMHSEELTIPHKALLKRNFALLPLSNLTPHWKYPPKGPYQHMTAAALCKKLGYLKKLVPMSLLKPSIVGILNTTPDSFSDGGKYTDPAKALAHYQLLVQQGAHIIDIGAESTRPYATLLTAEQEWARLEPVLDKIAAYRKAYPTDTLLSLDTRHTATVEKALPFGIDWINDVSGLYDEKMRKLIIQHNLKAVLMHATTIPAHPSTTLPEDQCPVQHVLTWAQQSIKKLIKAGINQKQIIFDPGIGFGKTAYQSLRIIAHLKTFQTLPCPVMLGHSRKSFMQVFTSLPAAQRDFQTALIAAKVAKHIDYLRVHDVQATRKALITDYFTSLHNV